MPDTVQIITAKRNGEALPDEAISALIEAYTNGHVPDYQMSAFLMAAFLRGLDARETTTLTGCMMNSGEVLDFSAIPGAKIDKHSTGGVGDKISLVLAPTVAACGVRVPMITGRALGHTGGTADKLESIPGYSTRIEPNQLHQQLSDLGVFMIGQTDEIAPADRLLYALRDVTATVDFVPFITASIMSKKLAEGLSGLVLDVKCGRGAFMQTQRDARNLAEMLVLVGTHFGTPTVAWLTDMNVPLGRTIGNWLEVEESVACLRGEGPDDVMSLTLQLCGEMLLLAKQTDSLESGVELAQRAVQSGRAFEMFVKLVAAQGGDVKLIEEPSRRQRPYTPQSVLAPATEGDTVTDLDALALGLAATDMGVGRKVKEDPVDPEAGIVLHKKPGDSIQPGEPLASFYSRKADRFEQFAEMILSAYSFGSEAPSQQGVLIDRLTHEGWSGIS